MNVSGAARTWEHQDALELHIIKPLAVIALGISIPAFALRWVFLATPHPVLTALTDAVVIACYCYSLFAAFRRSATEAYAADLVGSILAISIMPQLLADHHQGTLSFAGLVLCLTGLHPDGRPFRFPLLIGLPSLAVFSTSTLLLPSLDPVQKVFFISNAVIGLFMGLLFSVARSRMRARADSAQAQLLASDRMASIGVIAAGLGHEINNPLAYIQMNLAAVMNCDTLPLDERDALRDAAEGAQRIEQVVKNLGFFARPEKASVVIEVEPVLRSTIELVTPQIRHRGDVTLDVDGHLYIEDANGRLGQIVLNLLTNAIHALSDVPQARIAITAFAEGEEVVLRVDDNGKGIDPAVGEHVFDSFFTTKNVGEGTGLGLSICRHLAQVGGGRIRLCPRSALGGACFEVRLPRRYPEVPALRKSTARERFRLAKVLIVDDDDRVCRAMARALKDAQVTTAASGEEALDLLAHGSFDIVFCDAMMPRISGLDVYRRILDKDPALASRFVFVTGGAYSGLSEDDLFETGRDVLRKPVKPDRLRQAVADAVGDSQPPGAASRE